MKLLELIGCPFVDFTAINCNEDALTKLYLEHYHKGKKEGYTPIIMGRDMELQEWYWHYFDVPMRPENYPLLVQTIIEKELSSCETPYLLNTFLLTEYKKTLLSASCSFLG